MKTISHQPKPGCSESRASTAPAGALSQAELDQIVGAGGAGTGGVGSGSGGAAWPLPPGRN